MQSRLLPAPAARPAQPWPRRLCYPDLRARRLQARRGSGPGDGPARQRARRRRGAAADILVARLPLEGVGGAAEAAAGGL
jgi:hypothetical protein